MIAAGSAPGGLVFLLFDARGREIERAPFTGSSYGIEAAQWAAERHAMIVRDQGGFVIVCDGDTGEAMLALDQSGGIVW